MKDLIHNVDRIPLIRAVWASSTLNVEPLTQTWIRCECPYSNGYNGLTSPKRIQSSRALRAVGYARGLRAGGQGQA